jgi:carbamoyl-phosphate synthase large subunit
MGTMADIDMLQNIQSFGVEVVTADMEDKDSAAALATGKKYIVPRVKDSQYIEHIVDICRREHITTIIPQYSDELLPMAANLGRFREMGVEVLVTEDLEKLKIANSKVALYQFFSHKDFVPQYRIAASPAAVADALEELGYPRVPVCIKPAEGEGGKGFRIITEEKIDIFSEPPGTPKVDMETYLSQLNKMEKIPELVVMEYLPGKEYSVDCVCKDGTAYLCIPRQRIETTMGVATVSQIEKNEELIRYSQEIISALKLSYNINIQFKYSAEGRPKLVEINPRVSGSLVANLGAGVNMLESSLNLAYGLPVDSGKEIKWGTKIIRHWSQIITPP